MNDLTKYGFKKGFDYNNRFDLKTIVGDYEISTVDLGLDPSFGFGNPLYYETMIFIKGDTFEERYSKENPFEDYQERYATEEEATAGHKKAVEFVKKNMWNLY